MPVIHGLNMTCLYSCIFIFRSLVFLTFIVILWVLHIFWMHCRICGLFLGPSNWPANYLHSFTIVSFMLLHSITKLEHWFKRYTNKQYLWLQLQSRASALLMWSVWYQMSPSGLRSTACCQPVTVVSSYHNKYNVNLYRAGKLKYVMQKLWNLMLGTIIQS